MSTKHVNDDKNASFQRSHGRREEEKPQPQKSERERNIAHKNGEEHSRVPKGNRG